MANNRIVVGTADDMALFSDRSFLSDWQWSSENRGFPWQGTAKIRYRQEDRPTKIRLGENGNLEAVFREPERAVTPGQFLVAYSGDEVVGSGVIEK